MLRHSSARHLQQLTERLPNCSVMGRRVEIPQIWRHRSEQVNIYPKPSSRSLWFFIPAYVLFQTFVNIAALLHHLCKYLFKSVNTYGRNQRFAKREILCNLFKSTLTSNRSFVGISKVTWLHRFWGSCIDADSEMLQGEEDWKYHEISWAGYLNEKISTGR